MFVAIACICAAGFRRRSVSPLIERLQEGAPIGSCSLTRLILRLHVCNRKRRRADWLLLTHAPQISRSNRTLLLFFSLFSLLLPAPLCCLAVCVCVCVEGGREGGGERAREGSRQRDGESETERRRDEETKRRRDGETGDGVCVCGGGATGAWIVVRVTPSPERQRMPHRGRGRGCVRGSVPASETGRCVDAQWLSQHRPPPAARHLLHTVRHHTAPARARTTAASEPCSSTYPGWGSTV